MIPRRDLAERFREKVKVGPVPDFAPLLGPCHVWTAALGPKGYGAFKVGGRAGRTRKAHQVAWELLVGPIPEGLVLDHLCRVPACVRITHLELVTTGENTRRGWEARNSAICSQGHSFDEANTGRWRGQRYCRQCNRDRAQRWKAAKRQERNAA